MRLDSALCESISHQPVLFPCLNGDVEGRLVKSTPTASVIVDDSPNDTGDRSNSSPDKGGYQILIHMFGGALIAVIGILVAKLNN
jgi:hypothetical protein